MVKGTTRSTQTKNKHGHLLFNDALVNPDDRFPGDSHEENVLSGVIYSLLPPALNPPLKLAAFVGMDATRSLWNLIARSASRTVSLRSDQLIHFGNHIQSEV